MNNEVIFRIFDENNHRSSKVYLGLYHTSMKELFAKIGNVNYYRNNVPL